MQRLLQKHFPNNKLVAPAAFIINVLLVYLVWKILFLLCNQPGTVLNGFWVRFTDWFAYITIKPAALILRHVLGYTLAYNPRNIIISGTPGFFLANHCLGVSVCVIFSGFIAAYKGSGKHKLWYIAFGIFCLYAINIVRLVALGVTEACCYEQFFELAHTRVYLLMSYGMFFVLILWWMNYWAKKDLKVLL